MQVTLRCLEEAKPGPVWQKAFRRTWPQYRSWFLREGIEAREGYLTSSSALADAMPELVPIYRTLCELAGGGDLEARFLSLYRPPAFMSGCTQVAWTRDEPSLIRNYDYTPRWFEGVFWRTDWLQPVMGMSDCAWGLLDGVNGSGLAASLTFGGRKVTGQGFGVPLLLRYVLETCRDVSDALEVLRRVQIHMAYNLLLLDAGGEYASVYMGPDREPGVFRRPVTTNHQEQIDWPEYAAATDTVERQQSVDACLSRDDCTREQLVSRFLEPPLYSRRYDKSFGTLYTALYEVRTRRLSLAWPGQTLDLSLDDFKACRADVTLTGDGTHRTRRPRRTIS